MKGRQEAKRLVRRPWHSSLPEGMAAWMKVVADEDREKRSQLRGSGYLWWQIGKPYIQTLKSIIISSPIYSPPTKGRAVLL